MGRRQQDFKPNVGDKIFKWTVLSEPFKKKDRYVVSCECSCINKTVKDISLSDLKFNKSKSCGCYRHEATKTHGLTDHKLYWVFKAIKERCYNKKHSAYSYYGGRGIKVCNEWLADVSLFINYCIVNGWNNGLEIDRINNDGDYEQGNIRFVSHQMNMINQRLLTKRNTSGYKGIFYNKENDNFYIQLKFNGEMVLNKGGFITAKNAAIYRDEFIINNKLPHKLNNFKY